MSIRQIDGWGVGMFDVTHLFAIELPVQGLDERIKINIIKAFIDRAFVPAKNDPAVGKGTKRSWSS